MIFAAVVSALIQSISPAVVAVAWYINVSRSVGQSIKTVAFCRAL
jgi:hypothetical protein